MDKKFLRKLKTQEVYLWDEFDELLIKSIPPPKHKYMAKFPPKGQEFEIPANSDPVVRVLVSKLEVPKDTYDKNLIPTIKT